jgi:hypothetical protein
VNGYGTIDLLSNFKGDGGAQQAVTVTRIHLLHTIQGSVVDGDNYALGIIRGQASDIGSNIAGAPTPDLQPYEDWMYWEWRFASRVGASLGVYSDQGMTNTLRHDLRGQRRLEELQMNCNLVIKQLAAVTFPVVHQLTGRILLTLP